MHGEELKYVTEMYSLIKVDGFYLYLTGRSGNQLLVSNATEMKLSYEDCKYIKLLLKYKDNLDDNDGDSKLGAISKEKNQFFYDTLVSKHLTGVYRNRPNPVGEKIKNKKDEFNKLSLSEQIYVLLQILQLSSDSNSGADLRLIGEVKSAGVSTLNKKITDHSEFELISLSPSGLYKKEVDLLTV